MITENFQFPAFFFVFADIGIFLTIIALDKLINPEADRGF